MEFTKFLESTSQRDMCTERPDVVDFLIWKGSFSETVKSVLTCSCPKRMVRLTRLLGIIFNKYGRSAIDSPFPGLTNPAAGTPVKSSLSVVREEQLAVSHPETS